MATDQQMSNVDRANLELISEINGTAADEGEVSPTAQEASPSTTHQIKASISDHLI